jgi:hypothetical protein
MKESTLKEKIEKDIKKQKILKIFLFITFGVASLFVGYYLEKSGISEEIYTDIKGVFTKEDVGNEDTQVLDVENTKEKSESVEELSEEKEDENKEEEVKGVEGSDKQTSTVKKTSPLPTPTPTPDPEPKEEEVVECTNQELAEINAEIATYNDLIENSVSLKEDEEMEVCASKFSNCAAICYDTWEEGAKLEECYDDCETTVLTPCEESMDIKYQNLTTEWYNVLNDLEVLKQACLSTR